jgi:NAD(P)-dependent dehydrogenase (short-subunit alcohol dehydrogenase family)
MPLPPDDASDHDAAGPVALVTGAADGIGHAVVERLLADGFRVVAADLAETVLTRFDAATAAGRVRPVVANVSSPDAAALLVDEAMCAFGRLDAVVNNAGVPGTATPLADVGSDEIGRVFEVNLFGALRLCQAAAPHLRRQGAGRIVNLGSLFATQPVPEVSAYCMSKAAIRTLSHTLALELGPHGITVNTVAPGYILTTMHRAAIARGADRLGLTPEEQEKTLRDRVPLGRHGSAEDVAGAVGWLLSPDAAYVTGQTIAVDGGVSLT